MPKSPQNPNSVTTKPACDAGPSATEPGEAARRKPRYCARGKIALLKKPVRDKINELLLRGLSYPAVLQELGSDGQDLNANILCRYHKGPYRHWLREQHWLAEALVKEEPKRFTQVPVLDAITVKHIHRFFTLFDPVLAGRRLPLPNYMAGTPGYDEAWASHRTVSERTLQKSRKVYNARLSKSV